MTEAAFETPFCVVHQLALPGVYTTTESLFQAVRWWRTASTGVCCLAGIGGSGKTAAADELLRRLGVLAARPGAAQAPLLPAPVAALVFTLAQDSVEKLVHEIRQWVPRSAGANDDGSYEGLIRDLGHAGRSTAATGPVLLVIDGLEAAQSAGGADGIGRITDQRLRDLVNRAAYGALPNVKVLVTTRLAPADIEVQRLPFYVKVDMDAMDLAAAVGLLRARGLRGSDRELRRIGAYYGYHALSLDLAARYAEHSGQLPDLAKDGRETGDVIASYLAMARSPAAPPGIADLLELLSLFRRGVTRRLLGAVVDRLGLTVANHMEPALEWLTELRIVTRLDRPRGEDVFLMHELVRAFVCDSLSDEQRRAWHSQIAEVWHDEAEQRSESMDVTSRYDLLEAWLSHLVQGEDPMAAFLLYWQQIGNFETVGHQESRFAWGESVCRMLNQDRPPNEPAAYLLADSRGSAPALLGDWALYLSILGETPAALNAHVASYLSASVFGQGAQRPVAASNIVGLFIQRGELKSAEEWANRAIDDANALALRFEGMPTKEVMGSTDAVGEVLVLERLNATGVAAASAVLDSLAAVHARAKEAVDAYNRSAVLPLPDAPVFDVERFMWGLPLAWVRLRGGDAVDALRLLELNLDTWFAVGYAEELTSAGIRALMVRALVSQGEIGAALPHLRALESWARESETVAVLCESYLLRARVAVAQDDFPAAIEMTENGLRIARETGLGLLHTELLIEQAWACLRLGEPDDAAHAAATALFGQEPVTEGVALYMAPARDERLARAAGKGSEWYESSVVFPPSESGRPGLLAAMHPRAAYGWGEAYGRAALAEALLAGLARYSGRPSVDAGQTTPEADAVISYATSLLDRAAGLLDELTGSPESGRPLRERIVELASGLLTHYPVNDDSPPVTADAMPGQAPRRILISYNHTDRDFVDRLADELGPAVDHVWVDHREINIGESFPVAINRALRNVTDFVVVLTPAAERSQWVQNELGAALALRNAGRRLTIYPVLLDGVSPPPLLADTNAVISQNRDAATVAATIANALT